jgi:hypothetical protein
MTELWRHLLDLSIELDKIDEKGNYRQGRGAAPRRDQPQTTQPRSFLELREFLEGPPAALPAQPQKRWPEQPKTKVWEHERPGRAYGTELTVLPSRRNGTELIVRPLRPHLPTRQSQASENSNWLHRPAVFFSLAIMSFAGYAIFHQSNAGKGGSAEAGAPAMQASGSERNGNEVQLAKTARADRSLATADAYRERTANPPNYGEVPGAQAPQTLAELSDDAVLERASNQLNHGDVLGARAAYETLARRGSSRGAFGLAESYDPDFVAAHRMRGLDPDVGLARLWYERAAKSGSVEAFKRLNALTKTKSSGSGVLTRSSGSGVLRR